MSEAKIEELLKRWQELRERGDPPASEELCRDCPELLPALRQRLDAQAQTEANHLYTTVAPGAGGAEVPPRSNVLVLDGGDRGEAEFAEMLRSRLRLVALIYLAMWLLFLMIVMHADLQSYALVAVAVEVFVLVGVAVLLTYRLAWRVRHLRWVELGVFGILLTRITIQQALYLSGGVISAAEKNDLAITFLGDSIAIQWIVLIMIYGILIPNTAPRSALVVLSMALVPLILYADFAYMEGILGHPLVQESLRRTAAILATVCAVVIFTAYGMNQLRREVRAAKQLGRYILKGKLGQGGMGEVYLAEHHLLRRRCAVKVIRADRVASPLIRQRFEREAQIMANLRHPNIVEVFDYGLTPEGTFFYVMEYLPGRTLHELVEEAGPLPPAQAIGLLRQITAAVGAAHRCGLIHRDIKPANILITDNDGGPPHVKLLDFGLVHLALGVDGQQLTENGCLVGTPAFMSPEQIAGSRALDARSDIYSIGVVAYFLLAGRNPFYRPELRQIFAAHLEEPVPPLNLPADNAELENLVCRCWPRLRRIAFPIAQRWSERLPHVRRLRAYPRRFHEPPLDAAMLPRSRTVFRCRPKSARSTGWPVACKPGAG